MVRRNHLYVCTIFSNANSRFVREGHEFPGRSGPADERRCSEPEIRAMRGLRLGVRLMALLYHVLVLVRCGVLRDILGAYTALLRHITVRRPGALSFQMGHHRSDCFVVPIFTNCAIILKNPIHAPAYYPNSVSSSNLMTYVVVCSWHQITCRNLDFAQHVGAVLAALWSAILLLCYIYSFHKNWTELGFLFFKIISRHCNLDGCKTIFQQGCTVFL